MNRLRGGFSLIELVLATGLAALLLVAVFALMDTSMTTLRRSEERRSLVEIGSGVMALLEHDVRQLEGGARGDLVVEWVRIDLDGDGTTEKPLPLVRLVRQASAAEVARHRAALAADALAKQPAEPATPGRTRAATPPPAAPAPTVLAPSGPALMEVCWAMFPEGPGVDARTAGRLWRAERIVGEGEGPSFFEAGFLGPDGFPRGDALAEVAGGVLHFQLLLASQTSIVHDGWDLGTELRHVATSWDAWGRRRPNETLHFYNEPVGWYPAPGDLPVLPRRVRVEIEVERPVDRLRRPRLLQELPATGLQLVVDDADRLPFEGEQDRYILVNAEWMRIRSVDGRNVQVERAQRGTQPAFHAQGALVHHGLRIVREIPVPLFREDWGR